MANSFQVRMVAAAKSAMFAGAAIALSTAAATADDTELTVENKIGEPVLITLSGAQEVSSVREYRLGKDNSHAFSKVPDGKNIHWEAKPENQQSQIALCKGDQKLAGKKVTVAGKSKLIDTISLTKGSCTSKAANPPPKTNSSNDRATNKTPADKTQADKKPTGGSGDSGEIEVTFSNLLNDDAVKLIIYDRGSPGRQELGPIGAGLHNGKVTGGKNYYALKFKKGNGGKYDVSVSYSCGDNGKGGSGSEQINDTATRISFVADAKGGCKLEKRP